MHDHIERSFQTLLQYKIDHFDTLTESDQKMIKFIAENGYSTISVNLHKRALTREQKFDLLAEDVDIEYFNMKHYWSLMAAMFGVAIIVSLENEY